MLELKITDGTNLLFSLTDNVKCWVKENYQQSPAAESEEWTMDTIDLELISNVMDATISQLNLLLHQAKQYVDEHAGVPIYLEGRKKSSAAWKRSLLRGGELRTYDLDASIRAPKASATLTLDRKNFWETSLEASVPLTNANGSRVTTPILLFNHFDIDVNPTHDAEVRIDGDDIAGDLPAGCRLVLTTAAGTPSTLYYGCGWGHSMAPLAQINYIEGDGYIVNRTSEVSLATCSYGKYAVIAPDANTYWSFWGKLTAGLWYWPILRLKFTQASDKVSLGVDTGDKVTVYPTYLLNDFGLIPMPFVRLPNLVTPDEMTCNLYISAGAANLNVDYILLIPVNCGWRQIRMASPATYEAGSLQLIDDTMAGDAYYKATGPGALETVIDGPGLYLEPGRDQQIWFQGQYGTPGSAGGASINLQYTAQITYRPRYRFL